MDYDEHVKEKIRDDWDQSFQQSLAYYKRTGKWHCIDCPFEGRVNQDTDGIVSCEQCGFAFHFKHAYEIWNQQQPITKY